MRIAIAQYDGATVLDAPPLAAGLLAATIRRTFPDVDVRVYARRRPIDEATASATEADVLGISLYTWNVRYALEVARRAKAARPDLVVVAGGPSLPRRRATEFLDAHPWIDAAVLGEGELAFAEVVGALRQRSPYSGIAGVVTRDGGAITLGPPRPRLAGDRFEAVGSPYLDGTFDELVTRGEIRAITAVVLETNRGCPFACTFCDWGQATQSAVHEIPLERIERELEWIGRRRAQYLYLVDANFGIRRRDEHITRAIGQIARSLGAPRFVFFHLIKNATKRNLRTVEILREHGVGTQVALSMQDFDRDVLAAIRRDNIRASDALALREHCHDRGLSTVNELMLGLPAQTASSVRRSLVAALTPFPADRFFVYPTRVLENAELGEPSHRAQHGIVTRHVPQWPADPGAPVHVVEREELVVATASMTIEEWRGAYAFGYLLSAAWNRRLLATALHVMQFALGGKAGELVDALLASEHPRLSALRDTLDRYSRAILDEQAASLPVAGWGERRREPDDAVCACVFDDPEQFYAAAGDVAMRVAGPVARDAVAWDALRAATTPRLARFDHDWLAYEAAMGASPTPIARPIVASATPPAISTATATATEVSLESRIHSRATIERVAYRFTPVARVVETLRERARTDGFVYVPRAVPASAIRELRAVVEDALSTRGWLVDGRSDPGLRLGRWDDPRWHEFLAEVLPSEPYRKLAAHPDLLDLVRAILGEEPQLHVGDVCRLVSPRAIDLTTPPHQDAAYLADADGVWTAWLALGPCPLELGPLAMLPGSHEGGIRPHAQVSLGDDQVVGTDVAAEAAWHADDLDEGDAILFSALTVHRALPNLTADRLRVSVDFRYRPLRTPSSR